MAALTGKTAKIRTTSVLGTSATDNAATITTGVGGALSSVQMDATGRRHWDRADTATPTLWLNSTLVASSDIAEINPVQGIFSLDNSRTSTGTYTIDCIFLTNTYLTGGQSWALDWDTEMYDTTSFATESTGVAQWRTFIPGLSGGTVTISKLASTGGTTGPLVYDHMNLQSDVIVELITDGANHYEAYGFYNSLGVTADIDALTVESIDITIDGDLYFSTT
jgi:hypothetical protein